MELISPLTHAVREIQSNWDDQKWWRNRLVQRVNGGVQKRVVGYGGIDVTEEDWDTLLVFDACRADLFERHWDRSSLSEYRRVTSKGSWTVEWATRNFTGEYGDTVYVTANPLISRHVPDRWHRLVEVWHDGFDTGIQSVHPETVVSEAIRVHREYPNKRIIVHFVQPHVPFIHDTSLRFGGTWNEIEGWGDGDEHCVGNAWDALREGLVSRERIDEGYADNLRSLEQPVEELLDAIEGKVVLTSDHGNELGRRGWPLPFRTYGHPPDQRLAGLVRVPWGERTVGDRREIDRGAVESTADGGDEGEGGKMNARLEALGYVE